MHDTVAVGVTYMRPLRSNCRLPDSSTTSVLFLLRSLVPHFPHTK